MRPKLADFLNPDVVVEISEEETIDSCFAFVRDYHLLVGGSTGTVLAAIQRLAPEFGFGETIVAISPDLGERYLDTVYKKADCESFVVPEDMTEWALVG